MIKKIIYLIVSPFQNRDYKRFGVDLMIQNGFDVMIYDYTPFMHTLLYEKGTTRDRSDKAVVIHDEKTAVEIISKFTRECFVIALMCYGPSTFRMFKALSKSRARYAVCVTTYPPSPSPLRTISKRLTWNMYPKFVRYLKGHIYGPLFAKYLGIREPDFVFAGGEHSLRSENACIKGRGTEILWLHHFDYDIYLDDLNNAEEPTTDGINRVVFLAAPTPLFLRDNLTRDDYQCPLTVEKFYPSLCRFFDKVERELKVNVEIAGHPGADHGTHPECFGGRLTLHGQTFQMVKRSKYVITRDSGAINFPVLLKKPMMFITTDEAEAHAELSDSIACFSGWLGKKPINIDHVVDVDWNKELSINVPAYENFKRFYIKKDGSENINSWQVVANKLKSLS